MLDQNLPNYQQCLEICEESRGIFYETKSVVDGYNISIFNYNYALYDDFVKFKAFELRGLTFVFDENGLLYKRFPLLEKFFNLNENESTKFEKIHQKVLKQVYAKEDGSIISFIKLPNGKTLAKSKTSLESTQALLAQKIYESDENIKKLVDSLLSQDLNPIFELVGPSNRIVMNYSNDELILLALRSSSGKYSDTTIYDVKLPDRLNYSLDELIELRSTIDGIEGWVLEFTDGSRLKIKTNWYVERHRIVTDFSQREDYLIELILDEKIDDVISYLDNNPFQKEFVEKIIIKTNYLFNEILNEVDKCMLSYNGDNKEFALKFKDGELFPILMKVCRGLDKILIIKEFIKKKTSSLSKAKSWLGSF